MNRVVPTPRRLVGTAVIIGAAIAALVWVATYKTLTPLGRSWVHGIPPRVSQAALSRMEPYFYASPTWTTPTAGLIGIVAVAAAVLILRGL